jgi:CHAT domain-containing protein/tetratricopeptide (TPR) repeat protein
MSAVLLAALLLGQVATSGPELMKAAKARLDANDRAAAHALYQQAAAACERDGDFRCAGLAYNELGLMAFFDGAGGQVARWYGQAAVAFERGGLAAEQAMAIRATIFDTQMTATQRLVALERAATVAAPTGDARLQGLIRHAQGDALFTAGRFAESQTALEEALSLLEQAKDSAALARVLTSLGRAFRLHGRPDRALAQYERAWQIQQAAGDLPGQAQTMSAIAVAQMAMNNPAEAVKASELGLELARQSKSVAAIENRLGNLANTYSRAGRHREARPLYLDLIEKAISAGREFEVDDYYLNLADIELALGELEAGLAAVNKGLDVAARRQQPEFLFWGLLTRAHIYEGLGRLDDAVADTERSVAIVESLRSTLVPEDALKQGFSDRHREVYSTLIRLLVKRGRHAEALLAGERGRARAFLDLLATRSIGSETGTGATLLSRLRDPKEPMLRSFVSADAPRLDGVVATARRLDSHILTYWVDDDAVTMTVVSPAGIVNAARVEVDSRRLESLIRSTWQTDTAPASTTTTRGSAGRIQADDRSRAAFRELYDLLVLPVRRWLPPRGDATLTIVPHGPLFRLSFAALANERNQYLIEGYSVHYTPSVGVLQVTEMHQPAAADAPAVIIADPNVRQTVLGETFGALPAARREADGVAAALRSDRTVRLTGMPATEERVRELTSSARILHFATHGFVPDDQPFDGFLALSGESRDPVRDGRLTAREVYDLKIGADLVVLSGCRTARGQVTGDGVLGLSRAFLYAGAPSLMATLWDIYDDAGPQLLPAFYTEWAKSGNKAAALRTAQVNAIRRLRAGAIKVNTPAGEFVVPEHPAFWAGFVLVGEP